MLGVCGVALIALGVFGGSLLEDVRQSVAGVFEPEIVSEMVAEAEQATVATETMAAETLAKETLAKETLAKETLVINEAAVDNEIAKPAASIEPLAVVSSEEAVEKKLVIETENLTEVKASARQDGSVIKTVATTTEPATSVLPKEIVVGQVVKTTTGSGPNNTLYVTKDRVNLREGPSINHPIVLQLQNGQELMEFKREGKWIHVGAYGTSGKIGWVHGTLVGEN
jgi:uncharacterized protein YgiM (DUF1202 family)